jgi:hypothetical protein
MRLRLSHVVFFIWGLIFVSPDPSAVTPNSTQEDFTVPLRQSRFRREMSAEFQPLSLRDAARKDGWIGLGVRSVRWALDGSGVYIQ